MSMKNLRNALLVSGLLALVGCGPSSGSSTVTIQNRGSDTMILAAQAWAEAYTEADLEVSGGGSSVGISALINGTVDVANCSRAMTPEEIERARKNTGKEPKQFIVGYDAIAIYAHKDNPLDEISMEQLAQIYGEGGATEKWSQLGVTVPGCEADVIERVSRQNNSGTYEFFKEAVLGKGKYKLGSVDQSGSRDLVELVARTPCALGYSGMGYKTDAVKFIKVKKGDRPAVEPSTAAVHDGTYPISRPLYMYTLGEPEGPIKAFLDWVRTDAGQALIEDEGYVPMPPGERVTS